MRKSPFGFRDRIRHGPEYQRALINRGRLAVWLDEQARTAWRSTEPATGPGALQVRESLPPRSGSRHVVIDATALGSDASGSIAGVDSSSFLRLI